MSIRRFLPRATSELPTADGPARARARIPAASRPLRCAAALAALLGLTACSTRDETPMHQGAALAHPTAVTPADYEFPLAWAGDYTFRWSAAGDIDLGAPEAAVVRAFAESTQVALSVGARLAYPGYAEVIPNGKWLRIPDGGAYPPGAAEGDWKLRWAGTFLGRILRIQPDASGFTAMYCLDDVDVAESYDAGATYTWRQDQPGKPPRGLPVWLTVRSTAAPADPEAPAADTAGATGVDARTTEFGHRRAPNYDVFEGWTITDVTATAPRDAEAAALAAACTAWALDNPHINPAYLAETPSRVPADQLPEAAPPLPGWGIRIAE
ncbi:Uncharacterised protein [Nocardia otitidiscaviarum]|uniref:Uncharacterized protein n=1 Tax=Nocardia otitidiscaviarum TaxID=1823 RepID=A0A379JHV4_9NOCA|nr:hypothetical protein [Nocardia otitidiscaviarum]SUD47984.1 Uncharacterised protein [Nocardia otitidiscaviarum]